MFDYKFVSVKCIICNQSLAVFLRNSGHPTDLLSVGNVTLPRLNQHIFSATTTCITNRFTVDPPKNLSFYNLKKSSKLCGTYLVWKAWKQILLSGSVMRRARESLRVRCHRGKQLPSFNPLFALKKKKLQKLEDALGDTDDTGDTGPLICFKLFQK